MANATSRGHGGSPTHGDFGHGRDRGFNTNDNNGGEYNHMECQLYGQKGHTILKCFKRFDRAYTGEEKSASAATTSYDVGTIGMSTLAL
jgi:hypothetical protein